MDNGNLDYHLGLLRRQGYPLSVSELQAEALVECFQRLMAGIPPDDRVYFRADYDAATSALMHPIETDFSD